VFQRNNEIFSCQTFDVNCNNVMWASGLPFVDEDLINANFTIPKIAGAYTKDILGLSDQLINEVKAGDVDGKWPYLFYNFGYLPAALSRPGLIWLPSRETFRYTLKTVPLDYWKNKKVYLVMASGGVPLESDVDFASQYLKNFTQLFGILMSPLVNAQPLF